MFSTEFIYNKRTTNKIVLSVNKFWIVLTDNKNILYELNTVIKWSQKIQLTYMQEILNIIL